MKQRWLEFLRHDAIKRLLPLAVAFLGVAFALWYALGKPKEAGRPEKTIKVLSYSAFVNAWGPGPEIARLFFEDSGWTVELQDCGDAGLILKKLELFPSDVVVGLDQWTKKEAAAKYQWRSLEPFSGDEVISGAAEREFVPFDYGPMSFVYRQGEIDPPQSLDELLDPRFKGAIALQDPRSSTPGLQFLMWVLREKGIEAGFDFLAKLKPNLHSVSSNWSAAYGLFTKGQAKMVFSYVTSPVYHWVEEKDLRYAAVIFESGHPLQIEYAAVPATCKECEAGERFVRFLHRPDIQKIIMNKNFMMPVERSIVKGTPFERLPEVKILSSRDEDTLLASRDRLLERWRELGL